MWLSDEFPRDLNTLRTKRPLVHHFMNFVVMNDAANVTLAIGASPIMAHAKEEVEELASKANVLYINIGTLDEYWVESMIIAGKAASRNNVPILLDPVGAGATRYRTEVVKRILSEVEVSVVKGNGGEMLSLAGVTGGVKGVDSVANATMETAVRVAEEYGVTAVVTGPWDYVSDGGRRIIVKNGTPLLQYVTGSGCMVGSVIASFMGVNRDFVKASVEGLVAFEIAAEKAELKSKAPGTFKQYLIDELYNLTGDDYVKMAKIEVIQ
ncbi:hydroxyethylthiazole kinase [Caldivirga sp.]|uniref:hydroxyethylthiazole kinase n=1 Tax=Caldivirga sp. TaxID=2080243 RepID=UPI0025C31675|nr:hydroxyethylthiazole kinase [Caldivirga sp.]